MADLDIVARAHLGEGEDSVDLDAHGPEASGDEVVGVRRIGWVGTKVQEVATRPRRRRVRQIRRIEGLNGDPLKGRSIVAGKRVIDHDVHIVARGDPLDLDGELDVLRRRLRPVKEHDVKHRIPAGISRERDLFELDRVIAIHRMLDAHELDHQRLAPVGRALVADIAACIHVNGVRANQTLIVDRRRQNSALHHNIPLVHADVAALVLDGRRAERVLDPAEQDDVTVGHARRRQIADFDASLWVE